MWLLALVATCASAGNVAYMNHTIRSCDTHVVQINTVASSVRLGLLRPAGCDYDGNRYRDGSLLGMARASGTLAAITGTYFSPPTLEPVGAIALHGMLVYDGLAHSVLRYQKDKTVVIEHHPCGTRGHDLDWDGTLFAMASSPSLVRSGRPTIEPYGYHRGIGGNAARCAVGVTGAGKLLLVATEPTSLGRLSRIMLDLGAQEAINLDGGTSAGLWYDGRMRVWPGRSLTQAIGVFEDPRD
jgi:exopolysaccharide biosynthesis protein